MSLDLLFRTVFARKDVATIVKLPLNPHSFPFHVQVVGARTTCDRDGIIREGHDHVPVEHPRHKTHTHKHSHTHTQSTVCFRDLAKLNLPTVVRF